MNSEIQEGLYEAILEVSYGKGTISWRDFNIRFLRILHKVFRTKRISICHISTCIEDGILRLNGNFSQEEIEVVLSGEDFDSRSARFSLSIRAQVTSNEIKAIVDDIIKFCRAYALVFEAVEENHYTRSNLKTKALIQLFE